MGYTFTSGEVATAAKLNAWGAPSIMQAGVVRITPVAGVPTSVDVVFPNPFPAAPRILTTPVTIYPGSVVKGTGFSAQTATGFKLWITRSTATATSVYWQAFYANPAFADGNPAYASALNVSAGALSMRSGVVTITPSGVNVETSQTVTFGTAFSTTPVVCLCPNSTVPGTVVNGWSVTDVTATNFKAWVRRSSTSATGLYWIALGR